jgi:dethiobiotin synthetase
LTVVVCTGTGTEIGKTWVGAAVLAHLRSAGVSVAARKPVQSYDPDDATTDAGELAAATGEDVHAVCPPHRWYEVAMAPPMAADALGRPPFSLSDLVDEITWPEGVDVGVVESAGGLRSPMASDDADGAALVAALMPDVVVLVADAGLGTINSIRAAMSALEVLVETRDGLELVVVLNRFDGTDELHRRNLAWLEDHDDLFLVTSIDGLTDVLRGGSRSD